MKIHPSITTKRVVRAVERYMTTTECPGFCVYCGTGQGRTDPDARGDLCENCRKQGIYGAEELLLCGA